MLEWVSLVLSETPCTVSFLGITEPDGMPLFLVYDDTGRKLRNAVAHANFRYDKGKFQAYEEWGDRSNWFGLWHQKTDLEDASIYRPGIMRENFDKLSKIDEKEFDEQEDKFAEILQKNGRHYHRRTLFSNAITNCFLRSNYIFMFELEGVVDQLFDVLRTQRFV